MMKTQTQATRQTTTLEIYAASCNDCKRTIEYDDGRPVKGGAHTHLLREGRLVAIGSNKARTAQCLICYAL